MDHNSGRESYLLSRKAELQITDLVAPFLRVADMRIANLQGTTVRGMQSGRTEVQVILFSIRLFEDIKNNGQNNKVRLLKKLLKVFLFIYPEMQKRV